MPEAVTAAVAVVIALIGILDMTLSMNRSRGRRSLNYFLANWFSRGQRPTGKYIQYFPGEFTSCLIREGPKTHPAFHTPHTSRSEGP